MAIGSKDLTPTELRGLDDERLTLEPAGADRRVFELPVDRVLR